MEAYSEVDKDIVELASDKNAFRLSEAQAHLEGMNQEMASTLFYGNVTTAPEEFNGLAQHYTATSAASGQNVILGGSADTDNSSIWLVCWGANSIYGIFPKGSKAGLMHEDLGLTTVETTAGVAGARMRAYLDHFQWKCGLVVKDWRYAVRIPNIDVSNLVAKSSAADLFDLMIKAIHRIPSLSGVKPVFYMNRSVFQMLDIQRRDDVISGGGLVFSNADGQVQRTFRGIPVRVCDALTEAEAVLS